MVSFDDWKHWIDVYRERIQGPSPQPQMHLCTRFKPSVHEGPVDVPEYPGTKAAHGAL